MRRNAPTMRLALLFALLASPAAAYTIRLDARRCLPLAPARIDAIGPEWSALARYVRRCTIPGPDRRPALTVDIVRIDRAYADHYFGTHRDQPVPDPIIRDPSGHPIGALPEGFPTDPPGALRVTFSDWQGGLPRRIDLYEAGVSALPPHALDPLHWNEADKAYH